MSAATELPPVVYIPEQARRGQGRPSGPGLRSASTASGLRAAPSRPSSADGETTVCRPAAFSGRDSGSGRIRPSVRPGAATLLTSSPARAYVAAPKAVPVAFVEPVAVPGAGHWSGAPTAVPSGDVDVFASRRTAVPAGRLEIDTHAGSMRITSRGRVVLGLLGVAAAAAFVWIGHLSAPADVHASPTISSSSVVVHDGDTLWSIAGEVDPDHDPRAVVAQLKSLNHLGDVALTPGQSLRVR